MKTHLIIATLSVLLLAAASNHAAELEPLHASCVITASDTGNAFRLRINNHPCDDDRDCSDTSQDPVTRFTGISLSDLSHDGERLTAQLTSEAGTFTCAGTVQDLALHGSSTFTPNPAFVDRMGRLGFTGYTSQKLLAYTLFDITEAWVRSLKDAPVKGLTTDNLIALRIFHIDADYRNGFVAMGYPAPDAEKLIALKVQGVNAQEAREIREMGYQPSLDDLIQIRIFHITPDFIRRMQERGLHDLTISKLVQIKIFKLDE